MESRERILSLISKILEETAYIFTDMATENMIPDPKIWDASGVALKFFGKENGEMRMWASAGFARRVAANMLGVDEEDESAARKGLDALKESLNIILGNYLTEIYGEEPVFDLGLPEPVDRIKMAKDVTNPDALFLAAEEFPVLFVIENVKGAS